MGMQRRAKRTKRAIIAISVLGLTSASFAKSGEPASGILWRAKKKFTFAPPAAGADLNGDGALDIIQAGQDNRVSAIDALSRRSLWTVKLNTDEKLLPPVTGRFLSSGGIDILLVGENGTVILLEGLTGEILRQSKLDTRPVGAPATMPLPEADPAAPEFLEGAVLLSLNGNAHGIRFGDSQTPIELFNVALGNFMSSPPAIATTGLNQPGPHIVMVSRNGRIYLVPAGGESPTPQVIQHPIELQQASDTWFAVGDLTNDGLDDIAVADAAGYLFAFTVNGEKVEPLWTKVSVGGAPSQPIVMADVNNDGKADILVARQRAIHLVNGATGQKDIWEAGSIYNHDADITSPLSVMKGADGKAYALFGDKSGRVVLLDIAARAIHKLPDGAPASVDIGVFTQQPIIAGSIQGLGLGEGFAVGWTDGTSYLTGFGLPVDPATAPWRGVMGGPRRNGSLSKTEQVFLTAQHEFLVQAADRHLGEARDHFAKKEWAEARAAALLTLASVPNNREAQRIARLSLVREKLLQISLGALLGVGLLGFGIWWISGLLTRRIKMRGVQRALDAGDKMRACALMRQVYKLAPRSEINRKLLGDLFVATGQFDAASADVLAQLHAAFPAEESYLIGVAKAYSNTGRKDQAAAAVYADMMLTADNPGPWAFLLGECFIQSKDDTSALKTFRSALVAGYESKAIYEYLADIHVRLGMTGADALPVLSRAFEKRIGDADYLRVFLKASSAAGLYDETAQRGAEALLAIDPSAPEGHLVLATRKLNLGETKEAMKHAEQVLEASPDDPEALRVLGSAYASEDRLDQTAMFIFQKALSTNPEAGEILQAVSHGFMHAGRKDQEALDTYLKTIEQVHDDEELLRFVAGIAAERADDELTMLSCERLFKEGRADRDIVLQLADAYCRANLTGDEADPIYREALRFKPDHDLAARNLARIYARQGRTDPEAANIYESVWTRDGGEREVGRQLAFAYQHANMADKTLELTDRLLADDPSDNEIKRLNADAALALDQMESAVQGFEQVLEQNPDDHEALAKLAQLYARKNVLGPRTHEVYQRAIKVMPGNFEIHEALARAEATQKDWDQVVAVMKHFLTNAPTEIARATTLMEELVEGAPTVMKLHWFLVDTLIYDGKLKDASRHLVDILKTEPHETERALNCFDKILDRNPRDATAHRERARILFGKGRNSEARQELELAYRYQPSDEGIVRELMELYQKTLEKAEVPEVRFQLGRLAMASGKVELAISCFQKTQKDYRWEEQSLKNLARCFMQKGMPDLALTELRRLTVDDEVKQLLYDLGLRYESMQELKGAAEAYKSLIAADINYQDVKTRFERIEALQNDRQASERSVIISAIGSETKARYELIEELGRGAMGLVYKAKDTELDEFVALKLLPDSLGNNPEALMRFRREARNARQLSHPNIVRIHDIGEELGRKYISMEYVDGNNLRERLEENQHRISFAETLNLTKQICAALVAAHDAGIVHRDIKPANIMITRDGKVKVADFGIAKAVHDEKQAEPNQAGAIVGTPLYMSPEQIQGSPNVDYRSDIYALGCVLYEMVAGTPPFPDGDIIYQHMFTPPPPLTKVNPTFAEIVMKCLAKRPDERWQNVRQILPELRKIEL